MIVNADITIFNKVADKATRSHVFRPTVIRGVCFVHKFSRTGGTDEQTDDTYIIRIPKSATIDGNPAMDTYLPQEAYSASPDGHWTIQKDDVVLKGDSLSDVNEVRKSSLEHCLISEWQDNTTRGSEFVSHMRIGGV